MTQRLFCTALLAACASMSQAQPQAAPAMPPAPSAAASPAKKELVAKLIALQQPGIDTVAQTLVQQPLARMLMGANQALQTRVAADKREAVAKSLDTEARKYIDEVTPLIRERAARVGPTAIGPILEQRFSEDELRQLVTWFDSPLNKKYLQIGPEMQAAFTQQLVADARGAVDPKLKALEQRIATLLGGPPAAAASAPAKSKP